MKQNTKLDELDRCLQQVCEELHFTEERKKEIEIELSRRNVERSFKGMPANLIYSMYRSEINYIRDYGKLSQL